MLHVVCLKWGDKYDAIYVNRLFQMVSKNLSVPFRFYCMTENPEGIVEDVELVPLVDVTLSGWWYKLSIFQKDFLKIPSDEKILFLDLDIVILNNIDRLISHDERLCISADMNEQSYNSSVMCFYAGQYAFIWEGFLAQKDWVMQNMKGDQDWIQHVYKQATIYPKALVKSYKLDLDSKTFFSFGSLGRYLRAKFPIFLPKKTVGEPKEALIILFHGRPNPIDVMSGPYDKYRKAPWIETNWVGS